MNQNSASHSNKLYFRRSFLSCLLAALMIVSLLPASALTAKAEEGIVYTITLVAGDPGYMFDEYGTQVVQKTLQSDGSAVVLDVPVYPEGYTFTGWFADAGCTMQAAYDANMLFVPVEQNTVLYAGCVAPAPAPEPATEVLPEESILGQEDEVYEEEILEPQESLDEEENTQTVADGTQDAQTAEGDLQNTQNTQNTEEDTQDPQAVTENISGGPTEDTAAAGSTDQGEAVMNSDESTGSDPQDTEEQPEEELVTEESAPETFHITKSIPVDASALADNDVLFEQYAEKLFYSGNGRMKLRSVGHGLDANNQAVFDELKSVVSAVANGERNTTEITLNANTEITWSRTDLGLSENATFDDMFQAAAEKYPEFINMDLILDCLLADCPYEMYWFQKTGKIVLEDGTEIYPFSYNFTGSPDGDGITISVPDVSFLVDPAYRAAEASYYQTDYTKTRQAKTAAEYARSIVAEAASFSDYDKLVYYRQKICDLVTYNTGAIAPEYSGGLDPWQLIYVFDQDTSTNVVCEGYSKAFQYLCDQTASFANNGIYCISVTGTMSGGTGAGDHMWNIVHIGDQNYLVDVTNCDGNSVGAPNLLFLAGTTGSVQEGYTFTVNSTSVTYKYDEETLNLYGNTNLTIANSYYTAPQQATITLHAEPEGYFAYLNEQGNEVHSDTITWTENVNTGVYVSGIIDQKQVVSLDEYDVYFTRNWYTSKDVQDESTLVTEPYNLQRNIDLYAGYEEGYRVTFDANGKGYFSVYNNLTNQTDQKESYSTVVPKNEAVAVPSDVYSNDGNWTFTGWYIDQACTVPAELDEIDGYSRYTPAGNTKLYAGWKRINYSVTLHANTGNEHIGYIYTWNNGEGTVFEETDRYSFSVEDENPVFYPSDAKAYDEQPYAFAGWYSDPALSSPISEQGVSVTGDLDLYAKWTEVWVITLNAGEHGYLYMDWDAETETYNMPVTTVKEKVIKGQALNYTPTAYEQDKYVFTGWSINGDGSGEIINDGYVPDENMILYAQWSPAWTVTFDAGSHGYMYKSWDDGDQSYVPVTTEKVRVVQGQALQGYWSPGIDEGEDYQFTGWNTKEDGTGEQIDYDQLYTFVPQGNITLFAQWSPTWTVTFDAGSHGYMYKSWDDGDQSYVPVTTEKVRVVQGQALQGYWSPGIDEGEDYQFTGWNTKEDGTGEQIDYDQLYTFVPQGNITLFAQWKQVCRITFNSGQEGYFWYYGEEYDRQYTVDYDPGTVIDYYNQATKPITFNGSRKVFKGWYSDPERTQLVPEGEQTITESMTLYAGYEDGWLLTFHATNSTNSTGYFTYEGSNLQERTFAVKKGEPFKTYIYPSNTDKHYEFAWYWVTKDSTGEVQERYSDNKLYDLTPTGDMDLYAEWNHCWVITYDANEGAFLSDWGDPPSYTSTATVRDGFPISGRTYPSRENMLCLGWSTDKQATEAMDLNSIIPTEDTTVYAVWTDKFYTVTLNAGDGYYSGHSHDGETQINVKVGYGKSVYDGDTYWGNIYHSDNKKYLAGWMKDGTSTVISTEALRSHVPTADESYTAVWDDGWTLSLDANDVEARFWDMNGTSIIDYTVDKNSEGTDYRIPYTTPAPAPAGDNSTETPSNKLFREWNTESDGSGISYTVGSVITIVKDTILYALWDDGCRVTFHSGEGGYIETPGNTERTAVFHRNQTIGNTDYVYPATALQEDESFLGWALDKNSRDIINLRAYVIPDQDTLDLWAVYGNTEENRITLTLIYGENVHTVDSVPVNQRVLPVFKGYSLKELLRFSTGEMLVNDSEGFVHTYFDGWNDENGEPLDDSTVFTKDTTLYARWLVPYTITLQGHGGKFPGGEETCEIYMPKGKRLLDQQTQTLNENSAYYYINYFQPPSGKAFLGWYENANGTGEKIDFNADWIATRDMTLHAVYADLRAYAKETEVTLTAGEEKNLQVFVEPADIVDDVTISWAAGDNTIVSVDENGKIKALQAGTTTVTATAAYGDKTETVTYSVVVSSSDQSVTRVELNSEEAVLAVGESAQLTATVYPWDALNKNVSWSSDNETVASVDENGKVTAIAAGKAVITVTTEDGSHSAACEVTVVVPVEGVTLQETASLIVGNTMVLTPAFIPENASNKNVVWTTSNDTIVTVDGTGLVTAVGPGTATITVTTEDGGKTATCTISVTQPVTGVTLNKTEETLTMGSAETLQLTVTVAPNNASNPNVTWTSSADAVATVDASGKVTAVGPGTATITVTAEDGSQKSATCTVTVIQPVTGIELDKTEETLTIGGEETLQLTATVAPNNASNPNVTWTSSDDTVATVDAAGKVTAVGPGKATITVTATDGSQKSAACTVTVIQPVTGVELDKTSGTLTMGGEITLQLTAMVNPNNASNPNVTWTSSAEAVATVDAAGKVTAVGPGTATITAETEDGKFTATCVITVIQPVTSIELDKTEETLTIGGTETLQLTATVNPDNASNKEVNWTSSDEAVATVDAAGKVTAVGPGKTTITVTAKDGSQKLATCTVTVIQPVTGVVLEPTSGTLTMGSEETLTLQLTATVAPNNASNPKIAWTSSAEAVATVDAAGKVTAVGPGTATITAETEDGKFTATCVITVIQPVTGITLDKTEETLTMGGTETLQLTATVAPNNASNPNVTWTSSAEAVATVDAAGKVTAVGPGQATITATAKDGSQKSATCAVTVIQPVTGVTMEPTSGTLTMGSTETLQLTATVAPNNASNPNVTWTSSAEAVATVDADGKVTAAGPGTATITAETEDGKFTATCVITVIQPVTGITLDKTEETLTMGGTETLQLTATVTPDNASNKEVNWTSSAEAVATVDASGKVTAKGPGTTTITATAKDGSQKLATCIVTVIQPVTGVNLDKAEVIIETGNTETLAVTVEPGNATNTAVIWISSDDTVASVNKYGVVTAKKAGTATITVKTKDGGYTAACAITVTQRVTGVTLNKTSQAIEKGKTAALTAKVNPANATNKGVTWSSNNELVATVDADGVVTAVGTGTATITAETADGKFTADCEVTVTDRMITVTLHANGGYFVDPDSGEEAETIEKTVPEGTTAYDQVLSQTPQNQNERMVDTGSRSLTGNGIALDSAAEVHDRETLYVIWAEKCLVTFDPQNGKTPYIEEVYSGMHAALASEPKSNDPARAFLGWSLVPNDTAGEYIVDELVPTKDVTLYAAYSEGYTVTLKIADDEGDVEGEIVGVVNGESLSGTERKIVWAAGKQYKAMNFTAAASGKVLVGFSTSEDGNELIDDSFVPSEDTTLYAIFEEAETYGVTFDPVSGYFQGASEYKDEDGRITFSRIKGQPIGEVEEPVTLDGRVFDHWTLNGEKWTTEKLKQSSPEQYYAIFEAVYVAPKVEEQVTGITLDRTSADLIKEETLQLTATVLPENAKNKNVIWSSSEETVATVDQTGKVTAKAVGTTEITVKTLEGAYTASCTITVKEPVAGVTLNKGALTLVVGASDTLTATVTPDNAIDKTVTWTSSSAAVATVDANGKVTAKGPGSATITATTRNGGKTATCTVTVTQPVSGVSLNKTSQTMKPGATITLTATVSPSNASNKKVTWTSSNTAVATVDANGKVTAKGPGSATITAKTADGGKTAACSITVTQPVTGVSLNRTSQTMKPGETVTLTATVSPSNASNKKVTWTSSNTTAATVDANGKVTAKAGGTATITAKTADGGKTATCKITVNDKTQRVPIVSYRTHVQSIGWQDWKMNGDMSGTTGMSKRLEGININLSNLPYDGGITYRTHVQTYGWQGWKSNGEMAGTSGESKRLEAIQIQLTGELAKHYDVYYQTHIQSFGWSGWASNGEMCGSAGYAKRLEGIRIRLVKKGEPAPGSTVNPFYAKAGTASPVSKTSGALVGYNTHVQTYGWQNFVYDGAMSGTSGQSKRLEGIQINLVDKPYSGDIMYRTHVQSYGWQTWKKNGQMSGTSGESKRLEGIQIYLTGEMAKHYDVYYRVHAQTYGWLDYAKNGEMAGTSGLSKRLEGINIVLVPKGGKAPGGTARPNVVGGGGKLPDNPYKG